MNKLILWLALLSGSLVVQAQTQFQRIAADTSNQKILDVKSTSDSGYVYTGYAISGDASLGLSKELWIIKTDINGQIQWSKSYGGLKEEIGYAIIQSGNAYVAVGSSTSFSVGGEPDIYIIKVDLNGNLIWSYTYGSTFFEEGFDIVQTTNGSGAVAYAICGYRGEGTGVGFDDAFLMKIDASGGLIWFRGISFSYLGISMNNRGYALMVEGNDNLIVTGTTDILNPTGKNVLLFKSDGAGNLLWNYRYGSGDASEEGFALAPNEVGGQVITGYSASNATSTNDVLLMRTDPSGMLMWAKSYGNVGTDVGEDVILTFSGGHAIGAYSNSFQLNGNQATLLQTDMNGVLSSTHMYGDAGFDDAYGLVQSNDGGFNLGGGAFQSFGSMDENGYMIKTDINGVVNCYDSLHQFSTQNLTFKQDSLIAIVDTTIPIRNPQIVLSDVPGDSLLCGMFTGINNKIHEENINIYPNPADRVVHINLNNLKADQIEIFDQTGRRMMLINKPEATELTIYTKDWTPGFYFIKFKSEQVNVTQKLLILN